MTILGVGEIEKNGGDDGARTRDLRRDRFAFYPFAFNYLHVVSIS